MAEIDGAPRQVVPGDEWDGPWEVTPPWFGTRLPLSRDEPDLVVLEEVARLIGALKERPADVLRRRLGQSPDGGETLQEIGDSYELTAERIRQIEKASLQKLRSMTRRRPNRPAQFSVEKLTARLNHAFRSLHRIERGRYLRASFPEANAAVLARLLEPWGPATEDELVDWVTAFERSRLDEDREIRAARRLSERWAAFSAGTLWPGPPTSGGWFPRTPCRHVRQDGGHHWSEKLRRHVEYESGLEERLLDLLERTPEVVEYCEQPLRIDYHWFDGPRAYVPDFAVRLADGRSVLIEGKPRTAWADGVNIAKWNAATRWCAEHGWGFLVSDLRGAPSDLVGTADPLDATVLEHLTARGPARWADLRCPWFESGRSWTALTAVALTHGFAILRMPFEVRRARRSLWLDALARTGSAVGPT